MSLCYNLPVISKLKKVFANPVTKSGAIMFVGHMTGSFMNYVYNLLMGRMLGPADYGVLAALMSLLYIVNVPSQAITTTITKYTASYKGEEKLERVRYLFGRLSKAFLMVGLLIFAFFVVASFPVAQFLKIQDSLLVIMLASLFIASTPMTINNGVIYGLQEFPFIAGNSIFAALIKFSFAVLLAKLGFGVKGALVGLILSFYLPYFASFLPLKKLKKYALENDIPWKKMFIYSVPVFIANMGLGLFTSFDIVLVKRFFSPYDAGIYSALSLTSRTIYFASTSIVTVMFSLVAEKFAKKSGHKSVFLASLGLVSAGCILATIIYSLFPRFVMRFFFGSKYLSAAPYLGLFAVFISIYSLCNLLVNYFLSVQQTKIVLFSLLAAGLQAGLIYFFHESFSQVVWSSVAASGGLLLVLGGYYVRLDRGIMN